MNYLEEDITREDYKQAIMKISDPYTRYVLSKNLKNHSADTIKTFKDQAAQIIDRIEPILTFLYVTLSVFTLGIFLLIRLLISRSFSLPHKNSLSIFEKALYTNKAKHSMRLIQHPTPKEKFK